MVDINVSGLRAGDYVIAIGGLEQMLDDLNIVARDSDRWLSQAVNKTLDTYRTRASREIRKQVAFPARYLDSKSDGRLTVKRRATRAEPEGLISGRFEPTSLTRFIKSGGRGPNATPGRRNPILRVGANSDSRIPNSFVIKLRSGNRGLALRLPKDETIKNRKLRAKPFSTKDRNLFLLYGPSVDQVFRDVREDITPEAAQFLVQEFLRLAEARI